jgi:hypothetical protein
VGQAVLEAEESCVYKAMAWLATEFLSLTQRFGGPGQPEPEGGKRHKTVEVQKEEKADSDGQLLMEIQRRFIASRIFADLSAEPDLMGNQGLLNSDGLPRDAPTERQVARAEQVCGPALRCGS